MMRIHQSDCFKINFKFWRIIGIWPGDDVGSIYKTWSKTFVFIFIFLLDAIVTVNFAFLPPQMDVVIEELIFYTTELSVFCKVVTYFIMKDKIMRLLKSLDSDMFQPKSEFALNVVKKAMEFNKNYWNIVAAVSITSNGVHVLTPLFLHLFLNVEMVLPVCSFVVFPEEFRKEHVFPLYFYQIFGMHLHMLNNLNIDTFILGLLILIIAQLDILEYELANVTENIQNALNSTDGPNDEDNNDGHNMKNKNVDHLVQKLNECIVHYDEVNKFCNLVQEIFSVVLFVQFSLASSVICVCLFRFTLPAPWQYYIFLMTYMTIMILQILVPCWFGTRVMDKIMNSAYSFFTLLRHMQTRQNEAM